MPEHAQVWLAFIILIILFAWSSEVRCWRAIFSPHVINVSDWFSKSTSPFEKYAVIFLLYNGWYYRYRVVFRVKSVLVSLVYSQIYYFLGVSFPSKKTKITECCGSIVAAEVRCMGAMGDIYDWVVAVFIYFVPVFGFTIVVLTTTHSDRGEFPPIKNHLKKLYISFMPQFRSWNKICSRLWQR